MSDLDISVHLAAVVQVLQTMKGLAKHKRYLVLLQRACDYTRTSALTEYRHARKKLV